MKLQAVLMCCFWSLHLARGQHLVQHPGRSLSRSKRYVVFPEGSTFVMGICMTISALVYPLNSIFTQSIDMYLGYDLPNQTHADQFEKGSLSPDEGHRRSRRDLYHGVEVVLDTYGVNGRECILRTICESAQRLVPRSSMLVEMLRSLFTLPLTAVGLSEPHDHVVYDSAHRSGLANHNCQDLFPDCPMSLLDVLMPAIYPEESY